MASATLLFPLPLGPTMAVIPHNLPLLSMLQDGKKSKTVLVAKDLNPVISMRFKYNFCF
jgi:hypothetical protein